MVAERKEVGVRERKGRGERERELNFSHSFEHLVQRRQLFERKNEERKKTQDIIKRQRERTSFNNLAN